MLRTVAGDGRRGRGLRPGTGHAQRFRLHKITYTRGTRPFQTACNPHMWRYRASGPATTVRIEVADSFGRTSTKTMTRPKAFHIRMRYLKNPHNYSSARFMPVRNRTRPSRKRSAFSARHPMKSAFLFRFRTT